MDKAIRKIISLQKIKNDIWIYLAIKENIRKKNTKLGNVFFFFFFNYKYYNYVILYHLERQIKMRCKDCIKFRHKKNPTQN